MDHQALPPWAGLDEPSQQLARPSVSTSMAMTVMTKAARNLTLQIALIPTIWLHTKQLQILTLL